MATNLAFFKNGPSKTVPVRPGPVQCVRNCTSCILNPVVDEDPEAEDIMSVMSYDNLVRSESLWLANYSTILYHLGQITLLKRFLKTLEPRLVVYVVAATEPTDLKYLEKVLSKEKLPLVRVVEANVPLSRYQQGHVALPIEMPSCPVRAATKSRGRFISVRELRDFLKVRVDRLSGAHEDQSHDQVIVVPVAITKDDDESSKYGTGTICLQVIEPYSLNELVSNLKTQHKTGHLVQHLYHDLAMNGSRMPAHIVAFLLLYLDRPNGVTRSDLIQNMEWLRKSAMDLSLHLAFTGESEKAVEFALLVLGDYIHYDELEETIIVANFKALTEYASPVITNVAYYGILARAILRLHNKDEKNEIRTNLGPGAAIKVMKDDLLQLSQDLAESIDTILPCRPPCKDVQTCVVDAFTRMQTCGRYFRIQEARIRQNAGRMWAGDYDSDEEYFISRRNDPSFKPWVIMTQRPYRLDRLNLFMNAIEPFLPSSVSLVDDDDLSPQPE